MACLCQKNCRGQSDEWSIVIVGESTIVKRGRKRNGGGGEWLSAPKAEEEDDCDVSFCFCWYLAMVIRDKVRQVSRGFGFVTYENPIDAEEAVKHMDAKVRLVLEVCRCWHKLSFWTGYSVQPSTSPAELEPQWFVNVDKLYCFLSWTYSFRTLNWPAWMDKQLYCRNSHSNSSDAGLCKVTSRGWGKKGGGGEREKKIDCHLLHFCLFKEQDSDLSFHELIKNEEEENARRMLKDHSSGNWTFFLFFKCC